MFIQPFKNRTGANLSKTRKREELNLLLAQPSAQEERPCPDCKLICSCPKRSSTCCCLCGSHCPNIAQVLSSEPEAFPIEANIAPLVYAITSLRVVETCWSCEGHPATNTQSMKIPQVWFNTPTETYASLIAKHLSTLRYKKKLNYVWEVMVNPFNADGVATTFIMKPDLTSHPGEPDLPLLQKDLHTIASAFQINIKILARNELIELNSSQPRAR